MKLSTRLYAISAFTIYCLGLAPSAHADRWPPGSLATDFLFGGFSPSVNSYLIDLNSKIGDRSWKCECLSSQ